MITSFGSAIVELTLPLQLSEHSQMPPVPSWHKVVGQDLIEFPYRPLGLSHGRNLQPCAHVVTDPLGKFPRQPAKNGKRCVIIVGDPLRRSIVVSDSSHARGTVECLSAFNRLMSSDILPLDDDHKPLESAFSVHRSMHPHPARTYDVI